MPLVRADGLPTQHMRALAYWAAAPTSSTTSISLQVCGNEWVAHVTCRRKLIDALGLAERQRQRLGPRRRPADPRRLPRHGRPREANRSAPAKEGALLIDDLVEWIEDELGAEPRARRGDARATRTRRRCRPRSRSATSSCSRRPSRSSSSRRSCWWRARAASAGTWRAPRPTAAATATQGERPADRPRLPLRRRPVARLPASTCAAPSRTSTSLPLARYLSHFAPLVPRRRARAGGRGGRRSRCSSRACAGLGLEGA